MDFQLPPFVRVVKVQDFLGPLPVVVATLLGQCCTGASSNDDLLSVDPYAVEPPDSVELVREFLPLGGVVPPDEDRPGVVAVSVCPSNDEQAVGERHDGVTAEGNR